MILKLSMLKWEHTLNAAYVLLQLQQFYTNTSLLNAVWKAHRATLQIPNCFGSVFLSVRY